MTASAEIQLKTYTCMCGNNGFKFSISGGTDGKTFAIFLECLSCGRSHVYRKLAKLFEAASHE